MWLGLLSHFKVNTYLIFIPFFYPLILFDLSVYPSGFQFKKKVKGRFIGLFQHCRSSAYCIINLNKFPHSSPEAPRIIQMRETSTNEGGNYYQWILLANP